MTYQSSLTLLMLLMLDHLFVTSPVTGTGKPTRIWVLGDSGTANADAQAVANAYSSLPAAPTPTCG
ncbi:MAG: hypothetical protein WBQ78_08160 [Gammaproteobacteria bacterium]